MFTNVEYLNRRYQEQLALFNHLSGLPHDHKIKIVPSLEIISRDDAIRQISINLDILNERAKVCNRKMELGRLN